MDVSATSTAGRAMELNKAGIGQEIMSKSLEKSANPQAQKAETQRPVPKANSGKQGHIDTYA